MIESLKKHVPASGGSGTSEVVKVEQPKKTDAAMQRHTSSGARKLHRAQSRAYSAECSKQKKLGKRFRAVETTVFIDGGFAKAMTTAETAVNGIG